MPKIHITSLLRPRGRYKSAEDQQQLANETTTRITSPTTTTASNPINTESSPLESLSTAINNVELIPTLNFVASEATPASFPLSHVAATCDAPIEVSVVADNNDDNNDDNDDADADADDDSDSDSRHTYIIDSTATTTDTDALLRQEANFSLTDTFSSFVNEPTSSISIEMDTGKTTTTTTTAPASTATATTASASTKNSSQSVMTTITTDSKSSGEQSIEEEIEEAIDISEEQEEEPGEEDVQDGTSNLNSLQLSPVAGTSKNIAEYTAGKERQRHPPLLGIETDDSAEISAKAGLSKKSSTNNDEEQFKIDDDQLSGGQLAQHFVLGNNDMDDAIDDKDDDVDGGADDVQNDDDGENDDDGPNGDDGENDDDVDDGADDVQNDDDGANDDDGENDDDDDDDEDFNDIDISLPLEKPVVHSRHESSAPDAEDHKESLTNQSTADDVSDIADEARLSDEAVETTSEEVDLPLPDISRQDSSKRKAEGSVKKSEEISCHSLEADKSSELNKQTVKTVSRLSDSSSEHSEKDHSMEELMATNHSIEMTFEDKDLSSLNPSFDIHNESLVNRLLADTNNTAATQQLEEVLAESIQESDGDKVDSDSAVKIATQEVDISANPVTNLVTDFEAIAQDEHRTKVQTAAAETEQVEESPNMMLYEAKLIENKRLKVLETVQMQPAEERPLETIVLQPIELRRPRRSVENAKIAAAGTVADAFERTSTTSTFGATPDWHEQRAKEDDEEETSLQLMKLRILAMKHQPKELSPGNEVTAGVEQAQVIKQMERVPLSEFSKDVLEDITEESERNSLSTAEEQQSLSMEKSASTAKTDSKTLHGDTETESGVSTVSLNMIKMLEEKVSELQNTIASKDACLSSLNLQLETRRGSSGAVSTEQPGSARDTSSLVTNSTEYRTFQEDFGGSTMDIYMELSKRDELIAKLTDSLQQSMNVRENLQTESDKLTTEVQLVRKQLTEAMDMLRRSNWPRDQESNGGQRISEISMDLISESDDDLERQFLTDNEDKYSSRNSRERQLSIPRQIDTSVEVDPAEYPQTPFTKQIEQFQKYLTPSEVRLFFMVQKKFDDFLSQELEKCKRNYEHELKLAMEQFESERLERDQEIKRLVTLRQEKEALHSKEMEDLRKYFEAKCADLEKQFSDDVFSQKSQRHGIDSSSSDVSDQDQMPEEVIPIAVHTRSKETSPRKRSRAELLLSPSHRQMTPYGDAYVPDNKDGNGNISLELADVKSFYQNKLHELQRVHKDQLGKLSDKLKYYENRYPEDDFMSHIKNTANTTGTTDTTETANTTNTTQNSSAVTQHVRDANTSLIIIDQDELELSNETQVIEKIIEEYERRLQEQLALAREDIVHELEQKIQLKFLKVCQF